MRVILNAIKNVLIVILVFGFVTAGIDYVKMTSGEVPLFNLSNFDQKTRIQTYRGLFYIAERKVKASETEPLVDSSNMKYKILVFDVAVPRKFDTPDTFTVETKVTEDCTESSKLYFANLKVKVYTYCLDSIDINDKGNKVSLMKKLEDNISIIDDIDNKLGLLGLYKDNTTLMFQDRKDEFTNNGLTMYRCNKENINDVYFAPADTPFKNDFCTYKDDDAKFIFKIEDDSVKPEPELDEEGKEKEIPKETFYSDEEYDYQFEYIKSEQVFIILPAVRGRDERRYTVREVLNNKLLTIDDLKARGLKFEKVAKKKEE